MRYCQHCRRFNPGRPTRCYFCGYTWRVRLCPRGHENPASAQYCGSCGSLDLTETAGRRSWLLITFKGLAWLIVILFAYSMIVGAYEFFKSHQAADLFFSFVIVACLMLVGFWMCLSLLPVFISRLVKRTAGQVLRITLLTLWGLLKLIWRILR